jgi:hypothetical protein
MQMRMAQRCQTASIVHRSSRFAAAKNSTLRFWFYGEHY